MHPHSTIVSTAGERSPSASGEKHSAVIGVRHLKKSFSDRDVLKDISLDVATGENLAVLGKSGAGKSVLIKCIIGLLDADDGSISLFGTEIAGAGVKKAAQLRERIGFLFQGAALYDSMSVRENLEFPLRNLSPKPAAEETDALIAEALANVGLSDAIDKMPSELSGGMRKRLGLARTLIRKPEIMLYDEPTTGLDPITSREISRLMLEVQQTNHTSSIIITHDIECVKITSNRIIVISEGLCTAVGTYDELKQSDDDEVRSFFAWGA